MKDFKKVKVCYHCTKTINKSNYISVDFGWQQDDDAKCVKCDEYDKENCKDCQEEENIYCLHDSDQGQGYFKLPWENAKKFCSYKCVEELTGGKISWNETDACFISTTDKRIETRFFVTLECWRCKEREEQEWVIIYIYDPSCQNFNYRESKTNNKRISHA